VKGWKDGKAWAVILGSVLVGLTAGLVAYRIVVGTVALATRAWAFAQALLNGAMALNPVGLVIAAIVALGVAIFVAYKKSATFRGIVLAVWNALKASAAWIAGAGVAAWKVLTGAVRVAWAVFKMTPQGFVITHLKQIVTFVTGMPGKIASAATGMWDGIKEAFRSAINWIISAWNSLEFSAGLGPLPDVNVGTPDIPLLARGGVATIGGAGIVGDDGPEILRLPRGASIQPLAGNGVSPFGQALGGQRVTHVHKIYIGRRQVAEAVADEFADVEARR
jgi:hypothetical protein